MQPRHPGTGSPLPVSRGTVADHVRAELGQRSGARRIPGRRPTPTGPRVISLPTSLDRHPGNPFGARASRGSVPPWRPVPGRDAGGSGSVAAVRRRGDAPGNAAAPQGGMSPRWPCGRWRPSRRPTQRRGTRTLPSPPGRRVRRDRRRCALRGRSMSPCGPRSATPHRPGAPDDRIFGARSSYSFPTSAAHRRAAPPTAPRSVNAAAGGAAVEPCGSGPSGRGSPRGYRPRAWEDYVPPVA